MNEHVMLELKLELFSALLARETAFFDKHHSGALNHLLSADLTIVRNVITIYCIITIKMIFAAAFSLGYMFLVSWRLVLLVLVASPLIGASSAVLAYRRNNKEAIAREALGQASVTAEEALLNISSVHTVCAERLVLRK